MDRHYIIPIFVPHSGCPHDCIFCNQKKITGTSKIIRAEDVLETITSYIKTINANRNNHKEETKNFIELSFFGGSFTGIPIDYQNELLQVAKEAKDKNIINAIRLSTRPDYINIKILENLKSFGVDIIELGVQSMDEEVLNASERGHCSKDVVEACALIKQYGFELGLQMMVGLPKDNLNKDMATAKQIISLKPDFVRIYPSLVIKDTVLEEMLKDGTYKPLTLLEAVDICKGLYIEFTRNQIPIIRLGLQTTEQINPDGDVVGGPFHPAFRELVESSLLNDMVDKMIMDSFKESIDLTIRISPRDISKLFADKKRFFQTIINKYNTKNINIRQSNDIDRLTIEIADDYNERNMSLYEYIKMEK